MADDIEDRVPESEPPHPDRDPGDVEDELDLEVDDDASPGDESLDDDEIEDVEGYAGDEAPGGGDARVA
ncbi:MAG: hypothetical protein ACREMB_10300 [Candidatus Rokuibacteriota bacterium]